MAGICNSVGGGVFWHATMVPVPWRISVRVEARVVNLKPVDVAGIEIRSFRLSWNALITHGTWATVGGALSETVAAVSISTVSRLSRQSCHLRVGKWSHEGGWAVWLTGLTRHAFTQSNDVAFRWLSLFSGSEETAPRKTAENTVKHLDGSVGSVVANHRCGGDSSVVVTTIHVTGTLLVAEPLKLQHMPPFGMFCQKLNVTT